MLAVDYTEILRSLHEGGLVSDRVKREIESSAAITGWSCTNHHFFCFIALSHYAIYRSASEKQLSCIMIILSYFVAIGREWVRVCRCCTQHLCWGNGGRGGGIRVFRNS